MMLPAPPHTRPLVITVICILGFIGAAFAVSGAVTSVVMPDVGDTFIQEYGSLAVPFIIAASIISFAGFVGMWRMKKWGLYLYIVSSAISIGYGLYANVPGIMAYAVPLIVIVVNFAYFSRMD